MAFLYLYCVVIDPFSAGLDEADVVDFDTCVGELGLEEVVLLLSNATMSDGRGGGFIGGNGDEYEDGSRECFETVSISVSGFSLLSNCSNN